MVNNSHKIQLIFLGSSVELSEELGISLRTYFDYIKYIMTTFSIQYAQFKVWVQGPRPQLKRAIKLQRLLKDRDTLNIDQFVLVVSAYYSVINFKDTANANTAYDFANKYQKEVTNQGYLQVLLTQIVSLSSVFLRYKQLQQTALNYDQSPYKLEIISKFAEAFTENQSRLNQYMKLIEPSQPKEPQYIIYRFLKIIVPFIQQKFGIFKQLYKFQQISKRLASLQQRQTENTKLRTNQQQVVATLKEQLARQKTQLIETIKKTDQLMEKLQKSDKMSASTKMILQKHRISIERIDVLTANMDSKASRTDTKIYNLSQQIELTKQNVQLTNKLNEKINLILAQQQITDNRINEINTLFKQLKQQRTTSAQARKKKYYQQNDRLQKLELTNVQMTGENDSFKRQLQDFKFSINALGKTILKKNQLDKILDPMNNAIQNSIKQNSKYDSALNIVKESITKLQQTLLKQIEKQKNKIYSKRQKRVNQQIDRVVELINSKFTQLNSLFEKSELSLSQKIQKNTKRIQKIQNEQQIQNIMGNPIKRVHYISKNLQKAIA